MTRGTLNQVFSIAFTTIVAISCSSKMTDRKKEISAPAVAPVLQVDAIVASATTVEQSETVPGSIIPNRTVDVMSELTKKITTVSFNDGSYVRQGQILFRLDDADIRAKLRQLQAELNLAEINERRLYELLKTETIRQEEYDVALSKLKSFQASRDILEVELSKTFITAPFSGIIGISKVFSGTLVAPGMPLVTLQERSIMKLHFSVSEKYLPQMRNGNKVQFQTELNEERLNATIVSTEAGVDVQSRNITVQATVNNVDDRLRAGMSAKIYFNSATENMKGIRIPAEALMAGGMGYSVFLVKNGVAKVTTVTIGSRNESEALISSGISQGDTVMISNMLRAADGMPVNVISR